jgi:hypothetical protein
MTQVVECLSTKHEALRSYPRTAKKEGELEIPKFLPPPNSALFLAH